LHDNLLLLLLVVLGLQQQALQVAVPHMRNALQQQLQYVFAVTLVVAGNESNPR
jgi:hypothetical protein